MKTKKIQHSGKEDDCIIICKECGKECEWDDDGICADCLFESGEIISDGEL